MSELSGTAVAGDEARHVHQGENQGTTEEGHDTSQAMAKVENGHQRAGTPIGGADVNADNVTIAPAGVDFNTPDVAGRQECGTAISEEVAALRARLSQQGIIDQQELRRYTVVDKETARQLGFKSPTKGCLIRFCDLDGQPMLDMRCEPFMRLRHDDGERPEDGRKYSTIPGSGFRLFFPARLKELLATASSVAVAEGEKKASALSSIGFAAVGLTGWSCWHDTDSGNFHDDWVEIGVRGRIFNLIPDYDAAFNGELCGHIRKLATALWKGGAKDVRLVKIPAVAPVKLGIDDFITFNA